MANWLSSRLKAAEQLLQQIDQQAAATLHKDKNGHREDLGGEERTPERRSQSLRKEKEGYGITSTSDEVSGSSRGRGKLFDRPLPASKSVARKGSGEERQQRTPSQRSSKISPSPSQSKIALEGREDWSELLGSTDLVGRSSVSRCGTSRNGDLDAYISASRSSRTKTKSSALTPSSRTSSNGDLFSLTPSKANQLSLAKDPPRLSRASSYTSVEKAGVQRDGRDLGDGRSQPENVVEQEVKANTAGLVVTTENSKFAGEIVSADGNNLVKDGESKEHSIDNSRDAQGVRNDAPSEKRDEVFAVFSETAEVKELQQFELLESEVPEADIAGVDLRNPSNGLEREDGSSVSSVGAEEPNKSAGAVTEGFPSREDVELVEDGHENNHGLGSNPTQDENHAVSSVELASHLHEERDTFTVDDGRNEIEEDEILSIESPSNSEEEESSDSGTGASSDSEDSDYEEKRRARRLALRKKLAKRRAVEARAAAEEAARLAIQEREELVERLQREKESLEALLAEGEEQHVKMAAELQESMREVVQLLEQEKQLHNNIRRQGLELEVKLEAQNAELAKSLAASQRDLEEITSRVLNAREVVEAKVDACSDLQREAALLRIRFSRPRRSQRAIDDAYEAESMEEEKSRMLAKIEQLQLQAEDLQDSLKRLLDRQAAPSSIQVEIESQLAQITDSLIHKQAQVEELSTEKATLIFRVEAVSNSLREEKLALASRGPKRNPGKGAWSDWSAFDEDLEYGFGKTYSAKDKVWDSEDPRYDHMNVPSHLQPFFRLVRQVDVLVMGAALLLRRNGMARAFTGLYLLALHWWVVFILFSHPATTLFDTIEITSALSTAGGVQSSFNQSTISFL